MKRLVADKVKDGWLINITDSIHVHAETDVFKVIREQGLKSRTTDLVLDYDEKKPHQRIRIVAD